MLPKTAAAPYHVLPEPRLTFMDARRDTLSEWSAIERGADTLLVHGVTGLMQCREQCVAKVVLVDARSDADVTGGKPTAERMMGEVESTALEIIAQALRSMQGKIELGCFGERLSQIRVIRGRLRADRVHHRDNLTFELVEQFPDRRSGHPL